MVESIESALIFLDDPWSELGFAIGWNVDGKLAIFGENTFFRRAVARVARVIALRRMLLIAEVVSDFTFESAFKKSFLELVKQARLTEDVFGTAIIFHQLIEQFFCDWHNLSFLQIWLIIAIYTKSATPS